MVANYGPTGTYHMDAVLLAPENLSNLRYREIDSRDGSGRSYVFEKLELAYPDAQARRWQRAEVPLQAYRNFYDFVKNEKGVDKEPWMEDLFLAGDVMSLSVRVKPERSISGSWDRRSFQEIQFSPKRDLMRVELRVDTREESWAYFIKPGIYQDAQSKLLP